MIASTDSAKHDYDVIVVGAGFGGMYMLHVLRKLGFTARVYEAGTDVGGTSLAEAITAANLANDDLFIIGEGYVFGQEDVIPTPGELTVLNDWVRGGGLLLIFSNSSFHGGDSGNAILSAIGSSISLAEAHAVPSGVNLQGGNFATEGPPYDIVGEVLGVTEGNIASGGITLYEDGLHFEAIGCGYVYAFGDRYDHNTFLPEGTNYNENNGRLFLNIAENSGSCVPEPTTVVIWSLLGVLGLTFGLCRQRNAA